MEQQSRYAGEWLEPDLYFKYIIPRQFYWDFTFDIEKASEKRRNRIFYNSLTSVLTVMPPPGPIHGTTVQCLYDIISEAGSNDSSMRKSMRILTKAAQALDNKKVVSENSPIYG